MGVNGPPPNKQWTRDPEPRGGCLRSVAGMTVVLVVLAGVGFVASQIHQSKPVRHYRVDLGDGREVLISTKHKAFVDSDKWGGGTTVVIGNHRWDTQGDVHIERIWEGK